MHAQTTKPADHLARKPLLDLLESRRVMSLATIGKDGPRSATLFYAVADRGETLVFMSRTTSGHSRDLVRDPRAAASVFLMTKEFGKNRGVQLTGIVERLAGAEERRLKRIYYRVNRLAKTVRPLGKDIALYAFSVHRAKLTDSRFGFGKPRIWEFDQGFGESGRLRGLSERESDEL